MFLPVIQGSFGPAKATKLYYIGSIASSFIFFRLKKISKAKMLFYIKKKTKSY